MIIEKTEAYSAEMSSNVQLFCTEGYLCKDEWNAYHLILLIKGFFKNLWNDPILCLISQIAI